jgi:orotate phosphoribosyltransferase-like protein
VGIPVTTIVAIKIKKKIIVFKPINVLKGHDFSRAGKLPKE